MDTGRISEGAGGSPGFVSLGSDKGEIRSILGPNHIAYRGPPNHPQTGLTERFFSSFFQRLTRPSAPSTEAGKPTVLKAEKRLAWGARFSKSNRYWPNTTLLMIRPGTSVNSPASTTAPANIAIIHILLVRTYCLHAP